MLACLDQFAFQLSTAAYLELQRRTTWKHPSSSRVGARNARQFNGPGDDTITLTGLLSPDNDIGSLSSLKKLRKMGDDGEAYVLVDGAGHVYGAFIIESVEESQTLFKVNGTPRRVEFTINLARVDDGLIRDKFDTTKRDSRAKQ
ncbi:phage tail protein [Trinickia sp. LjRoot230]|uniref:phage tail protein n=1 Tax=Trinickia sp. LjRoot230 TaxID=3342288 RepID=UPI003ECE3509